MACGKRDEKVFSPDQPPQISSAVLRAWWIKVHQNKCCRSNKRRTAHREEGVPAFGQLRIQPPQLLLAIRAQPAEQGRGASMRCVWWACQARRGSCGSCTWHPLLPFRERDKPIVRAGFAVRLMPSQAPPDPVLCHQPCTLPSRPHSDWHCGLAASHVSPYIELSTTIFQCRPTFRLAYGCGCAGQSMEQWCAGQSMEQWCAADIQQ